MGFTPNIITITSFIFGLVACYFLYKKKILLFVMLYIISYALDCMDGYMARKYNMQSKFGDYLDHITDLIVLVIISLILIYKYKLIKHKFIIIIAILFIFIEHVHIGCKEILSSDKHETLSGGNTILCSKKAMRHIQSLRFFGSGFNMLMITFIAVYLSKYKT